MNYAKYTKLLPKDSFYKNSIIFVFGTFAANAVNYLFRLVVGRIVSVDNYGQVESLVSILNIFSVFAVVLTLFFTDMAARHKAQNVPNKSKSILEAFVGKFIVFSLAAFVFLAIVSVPIKHYLGINNIFSLFAVWASVLLTIFLSAGCGILKGWQKFGWLVVSGIGGAIAKMVFGVAIILAGFQVFGTVISFGIGSVVSLTIISYFLKREIFKNGITLKKDGIFSADITLGLLSHWKKISAYFCAVMAIAIFANADMIAARHNLPDYFASGFGALSLTSKIIYFTCSSVVLVFFSHAAERNYGKKISPIFKQAFFLISAIAILSTGFYFIFPSFMLWIIYGSKYAFFSSYLGYFAVVSSLLSINNLLSYHLISDGQTRFMGLLLIISLLFFLTAAAFGKSLFLLLVIMMVFQLVAIVAQVIAIKFQKYAEA